MNNYRQQDGCHSCKHVFVEYGYQHVAKFCTKNAPERPKGAEHEQEDMDFHGEGADANLEICDQWDKWRRGRGVRREGICDDFEKVEGDESDG